MKQSAQILMEMPVSKSLKMKMKSMGIDEEDATYQMGVMVAMLQEALAGNVRASQFIREMLDEDPKQEMQRKEYQLRKQEFEYKKEQDEQTKSEQDSSSLADEILEAWEKRTGGSEKDDNGE